MAAKKRILKVVNDGKTGIIQAPKAGLNNLRCECGGTLVRQKHNGSLVCGGCKSRRVETPL
jgi:hypothetical protein